MPRNLKFIIYAPRYNEQSGGAIVLHKLCDSLNRLGYSASLWPMSKPRFTWKQINSYSVQIFLYHAIGLFRRPFVNLRALHAPIASTSDIDSSIVVYPEVVDGNPLLAPRYVRWFLHKPGFHSGLKRAFDRELYFYYIETFNAELKGAICGGKLTVLENFRDLYKIKNFGIRSKVCYLIRKGKNRADLPDLNDCWVLDGLDHTEMAKAFNECAKCYFYDQYTFYSTYAALCGCLPIIVPISGIAKEQWHPQECFRYGHAYGEEDIPYALATRDLLIDRLNGEEEENENTIHQFVERAVNFFNHPANF